MASLAAVNDREVHTTWVLNMHKCADIHQSMVKLTNIGKQKHDQHMEISKSWILRDHTDMRKLLSWFQLHDLLQPGKQRLFIFWDHIGTI